MTFATERIWQVPEAINQNLETQPRPEKEIMIVKKKTTVFMQQYGK